MNLRKFYQLFSNYNLGKGSRIHLRHSSVLPSLRTQSHIFKPVVT